ncbi:MAG: hypothetical protein CMH55_05400 [Myxococcales bacterium]|nr:hypothetical protein [Myxococcales bacterium]|tara:strand:- start:116 stop:598 length:483 start_codon:yes stop_codon:yes gene_type:complete
MIDSVLIIIGACFVLAGVIGSLIPVIPGPLLTYLGLLALHSTELVEVDGLILFAVLTVVVAAIEYFLPLYVGRKLGATRAGVYGGILGTLIGLLFMPIGIIVGPMIGALAFESMTKRSVGDSLKASIGVFLGTVINFALRFALCVWMAYVFVVEVMAVWS